ncbi:hypothetical protein HDU98_007987 [Podochytrium sp. JEL0797]|nr:hypothetical protein HDU98_007987 [Podochytrium sp. JEL0797]
MDNLFTAEQISALLQNLTSLDTLRAQIAEMRASLSVNKLVFAYFELDVVSQIVVAAIVILVMRMVVGMVRSTLRTAFWTLKMALIVVAIGLVGKYVLV